MYIPTRTYIYYVGEEPINILEKKILSETRNNTHLCRYIHSLLLSYSIIHKCVYDFLSSFLIYTVYYTIKKIGR